MSTNCLVTKLKGTVDADLERFGMLRVHLDAGSVVTGDTDRSQLNFGAVDTTTSITIVMDNITDGCHFTNNAGTEDMGTEITITPNVMYQTYVVYVSKGSCDLFVPKALITGYSGSDETFKDYDRVSFNIDDMAYYDNFGKYRLGFSNIANITNNAALQKVKGNIDNIKGTGMDRLSINGTPISGDLTSFMTRNIATIIQVEAYNSPCTFDLSVLDSLDCTNVASVRIPDNTINLDIVYYGNINNNIPIVKTALANTFIGSIESYAQKRASLYGAGSNTSNLALFGNVTYQGTKLSELTLSSSVTFTWDAGGNITSFE